MVENPFTSICEYEPPHEHKSHQRKPLHYLKDVEPLTLPTDPVSSFNVLPISFDIGAPAIGESGIFNLI